jgi:hypothetical protein
MAKKTNIRVNVNSPAESNADPAGQVPNPASDDRTGAVAPSVDLKLSSGIQIGATTNSFQPTSDSAAAQPTNALDLWRGEMPKAPPIALSVIRLDANEKTLIPFTTAIVRAVLHFMDYKDLRGYVHCNGVGCLLCRLGVRIDQRDLLPLYDPIEETIGILPVSPNQREHALLPQLLSALEKLSGGRRSVLIVRKPDKTRFSVTTNELADSVQDGAAEILAFQERFARGEIDLGSVFTRLTNAELAALPSIAKLLRLRGLSAP